VPTTSSTPAAPVWSIPASPVVSSSSSSSPVWSDPVWSVPADPVWSIPAAPVVSSSSSPAAPVWSAPAAPVWSAPAAPVWSAPAAAATSSAAPSSGVITNGNKWGVTYTPYTPAGQCKTADEVDADIAKIASWGFTTVRLYATDCSGLTNVGASTKAHGLKIIVGVFIDSKGPGAAWSQVDDITTWGSAGNWAHVSGIVVGNEAIFNGYTSASDLAGLITKAKGAWTGAGYSGWVTTTEPVDVIQKWASTLSSVVDVAAANIQPFFTSSVSSSWAGSFVAGQLALIEAAFPGKTAYNLESGWPSAGSSNGAAVASPSDQKAAIDDIIAKAGDKSCIFSFEDDSWKEAGSFGVEKSFGVSDLFSSY
jgi:exo-beta-1,3-glucanase (GH17 family)